MDSSGVHRSKAHRNMNVWNTVLCNVRFNQARSQSSRIICCVCFLRNHLFYKKIMFHYYHYLNGSTEGIWSFTAMVWKKYQLKEQVRSIIKRKAFLVQVSSCLEESGKKSRWFASKLLNGNIKPRITSSSGE